MESAGRRESSGVLQIEPHEHSAGIQDALGWQLLRASQVCVAKLARVICHNGRNEVCFRYGCSCENESDLLWAATRDVAPRQVRQPWGESWNPQCWNTGVDRAVGSGVSFRCSAEVRG